jgi:hypothetical protein
MLPKSFLQLKGITVGNFNMGCNFRIDNAIIIMIHYKLDILAIQEHTPWNRELSEGEIASIERHCNRWGYFVKISKLQILLIDKQLIACHRITNVYEDGRIIQCRLEISENQFVSLLPVYGIPHAGGEKLQPCDADVEENSILQRMTTVQNCLHDLLNDAIKSNDIIFVFGDLQDTPDNTKLFHYGSCRLPKHPLGIVAQCESLDLMYGKVLGILERKFVVVLWRTLGLVNMFMQAVENLVLKSGTFWEYLAAYLIGGLSANTVIFLLSLLLLFICPSRRCSSKKGPRCHIVLHLASTGG